jgi:hypothetical protein
VPPLWKLQVARGTDSGKIQTRHPFPGLSRVSLPPCWTIYSVHMAWRVKDTIGRPTNGTPMATSATTETLVLALRRVAIGRRTTQSQHHVGVNRCCPISGHVASVLTDHVRHRFSPSGRKFCQSRQSRSQRSQRS